MQRGGSGVETLRWHGARPVHSSGHGDGTAEFLWTSGRAFPSRASARVGGRTTRVFEELAGRVSCIGASGELEQGVATMPRPTAMR